MSNVKKFLTDLSSTPSALNAFKKDPEKAISGAGLTKEEKEIVLSGDPIKIRAVFEKDSMAVVPGVVVVVVVAVIR